jgi:hypothetical protein
MRLKRPKTAVKPRSAGERKAVVLDLAMRSIRTRDQSTAIVSTELEKVWVW